MKSAAMTSRWLRLTPATMTTPSQMAMKTMLVPRSGSMKTKPTAGTTMASEMRSVLRSFASPPCSLKKRARRRMVASLANSDGCTWSGPRLNQRTEPPTFWPTKRMAISETRPMA